MKIGNGHYIYISTTLYEEQDEWISNKAKEKNVPKSQIVRELIQEQINRENKLKSKQKHSKFKK